MIMANNSFENLDLFDSQGDDEAPPRTAQRTLDEDYDFDATPQPSVSNENAEPVRDGDSDSDSVDKPMKKTKKRKSVPARRASKVALEAMQTETERLLRQRPVNLPYVTPESLSLHDFLQSRGSLSKIDAKSRRSGLISLETNGLAYPVQAWVQSLPDIPPDVHDVVEFLVCSVSGNRANRKSTLLKERLIEKLSDSGKQSSRPRLSLGSATHSSADVEIDIKPSNPMEKLKFALSRKLNSSNDALKLDDGRTSHKADVVPEGKSEHGKSVSQGVTSIVSLRSTLLTSGMREHEKKLKLREKLWKKELIERGELEPQSELNDDANSQRIESENGSDEEEEEVDEDGSESDSSEVVEEEEDEEAVDAYLKACDKANKISNDYIEVEAEEEDDEYESSDEDEQSDKEESKKKPAASLGKLGSKKPSRKDGSKTERSEEATERATTLEELDRASDISDLDAVDLCSGRFSPVEAASYTGAPTKAVEAVTTINKSLNETSFLSDMPSVADESDNEKKRTLDDSRRVCDDSSFLDDLNQSNLSAASRRAQFIRGIKVSERYDEVADESAQDCFDVGVRTKIHDTTLEAASGGLKQTETEGRPLRFEDNDLYGAGSDDDDSFDQPTTKKKHTISESEDEEEEEPADDTGNRSDDEMALFERLEAEQKKKKSVKDRLINKRGEIRREFVEHEAELSGSEDEEGDEDERGLDEYEEDMLGDEEDVPSDEELAAQVNRIHQKKVLEEDRRRLLLYKEKYIDDQSSSRRMRRFAWGLEGENEEWWGDEADQAPLDNAGSYAAEHDEFEIQTGELVSQSMEAREEPVTSPDPVSTMGSSQPPTTIAPLFMPNGRRASLPTAGVAPTKKRNSLLGRVSDIRTHLLRLSSQHASFAGGGSSGCVTTSAHAAGMQPRKRSNLDSPATAEKRVKINESSAVFRLNEL